MDPAFVDLRACMFATQHELQRFRQLVVNAVVATDIFDPQLKAMRENRWQVAFSSDSDKTSSSSGEDVSQAVFRNRATIVLEYIVQASDVCHCMQHATIYLKWNKALFTETYVAYKAGRADKDPSEGWYRGELWFYDNYVIPLAKKREFFVEDH